VVVVVVHLVVVQWVVRLEGAWEDQWVVLLDGVWEEADQWVVHLKGHGRGRRGRRYGDYGGYSYGYYEPGYYGYDYGYDYPYDYGCLSQAKTTCKDSKNYSSCVGEAYDECLYA
jgi:hypothetical protein